MEMLCGKQTTRYIQALPSCPLRDYTVERNTVIHFLKRVLEAVIKSFRGKTALNKLLKENNVVM